jgi:acyl carrier protein
MNGDVNLEPAAGSVRSAIVDILEEIAPEIAGEQIDPAEDLRDQLDIDSIDVLTLMIGIHERFGIDVPEADYARLLTLNDIVDYLRAHGIESFANDG